MKPGAVTKFDKVPSDTISDICISSSRALVCASSWDGTIMIYQMSRQAPNTAPSVRHVTTLSLGERDPVLRCCLNGNDDIFFGTAQGDVKMVKFGQEKVDDIGRHCGIVSGVKWSQTKNCLITSSSYDYCLKLWDVNSGNKAIGEMNLPAKCVGFDCAGDNVFVLTADNAIQVVDVRDLKKPAQRKNTHITSRPTSIACAKDGKSFVVGSIDGVVDFNKNGSSNLFPAHRKGQEAYSVNCLGISRNSNNKDVIISGGGDGSVEFFSFDKPAQTGNKMVSNSPVTALAISNNPQFPLTYCVATGYDWSQGADAKGNQPIEMQVRMWSSRESG